MKVLNFFPIYRQLIQKEEKTTTIRLGDKRHEYFPNDNIEISVGWNLNSVKILKQGIIESVVIKKIKDLSPNDLVGESPDCLSTDAVKYVLGSIYKKNVSDESVISIIKWRYF